LSIHKFIFFSNFFQSNAFIVSIGLLAGVLSALSMLPQVIKTLREKKAEDVSPVMLIVLISGLALWVFYGVLKHDLPIMFTNGFSLLLNIFMLFLRWKYANR
jgi:MtN3 and saliva related transmembrane protein